MQPTIPSRTALIALVLTNLIPLFGVLFFGWSLFMLMLLYWFESGVVGVLNIVRMLLAAGDQSTIAHKIGEIVFFVVHYGAFWLAHGLAVLVIFGFDLGDFGIRNQVQADLQPHALVGIRGAALFLIISHTISFLRNYLVHGEYRTATVDELMMAPYGRVITLHVVVLLGGVAILFVGQPTFALVLLTAGKLMLDLRAHLREHRQRQPAWT